MRAISCPALGQDLIVTEVERQPLGPGQVRIKIAAAGVNFADTLMIVGTYQEPLTPPFVPGLELSGHVIETAPGVTRTKVGDRVIAVVVGGAWAEETVTDEANVFPLPDHLDLIQAAGFPIVYGTSLGALAKAELKAGESLVVLGASGGVGLTAVEIGSQWGAEVIACASSPEKLAVAKDYGAKHLLDSTLPDLRGRIKALTEGKGAHVSYDPVGGLLFEESLRSMRAGGRMLVIGFASGKVPPIPANILLVKNITVIGYNWGGYKKIDRAAFIRSVEDSIALWAEGRLKPHVSNVLDLDQAPQALDLLRTRAATGKVVLKIGA